MESMVRMTRRKEEGNAQRIRMPLIWSLTFHLLAVSSAILLGGRAASVPFRGVVDVLLVGAAEGERAAAKRAAPRERRARSPVPRGEDSFPGRQENGAGPSAPLSRWEETGPSRTLPDPSDHPAGAAPGREDEVRMDHPSLPGKAMPPDPAQFARGREAAAGTDPLPKRGGREATGSGSAAEGVEAGPGAAATASRDPVRPEEPRGSGGGISVLRERIQSRIVYPEEAVRRGQEGDVLLRIRIAEGGVPGEVRIARSSGVRSLDDAARRGVVRAAPLPGRTGWVEVPVFFRLR